MNLGGCRLVLRERDPLGTLDLAVAFGRAEGGALARTVAWAAGPWVAGLGVWAMLRPSDGPIVFGIAVLAGPVVQWPVFAHGVLALFDARPSAAAVWRAAWARWAFVPVTALRSALVALAGLVSFGLLAVLVAPALWWAPETVVLERRGVVPGVVRALGLSGRAGALALIGTMACAAVPLWAVGVAEASGQALVGSVLQLGAPFGRLIADGRVTPFVVAGWVLAQPVLAWVRLVAYLDARTATEGWDLQVAVDAIARGDA